MNDRETGSVVVGPWTGSTRIPPPPPRHTAPQRRRYVPRRVYTDRYGHRALMYCAGPDCRRPFDPYMPIPDDKLCAECRPLHTEDDPDTPGLFSLDELRQP